MPLSNEEEGKRWMQRGTGTCRRSSCLQIKSETNTEHESVTLQNVIGAAPSKSHRDNLGRRRNPSGNTKYVGFISRIHLVTSPKVTEQIFCLSRSFKADQSDVLPVEPRLPTGASRDAPHCLTKLIEKPDRSEAKTCQICLLS